MPFNNDRDTLSLLISLKPGPETFLYEFEGKAGKHAITFEAANLDEAFALLCDLRSALLQKPSIAVTKDT